jgi:hypothetical protein
VVTEQVFARRIEIENAVLNNVGSEYPAALAFTPALPI